MLQGDETRNGVREVWHPVSQNFDEVNAVLDKRVKDGGGTIKVSLIESTPTRPAWMFIESSGQYVNMDHADLCHEAERLLLE